LEKISDFSETYIVSNIAAGLPLQELELLHNFSTQTASTLHGDPLVQTLFRTQAPQLGLKYDFLMRAVLALSGLHLAHYRPDQYDYYVSQALHHHESGLRGASSLIPYITEENCSALYVFSVLTFYTSLAKPRTSNDFFFISEHGTADWLFLIRGTKHILEATYVSLRKGPFAPLFASGEERHKLREEAARVSGPNYHYALCCNSTSLFHATLTKSAYTLLARATH